LINNQSVIEKQQQLKKKMRMRRRMRIKQKKMKREKLSATGRGDCSPYWMHSMLSRRWESGKQWTGNKENERKPTTAEVTATDQQTTHLSTFMKMCVGVSEPTNRKIRKKEPNEDTHARTTGNNR
jgi:hypothetical protein